MMFFLGQVDLLDASVIDSEKIFSQCHALIYIIDSQVGIELVSLVVIIIPLEKHAICHKADPRYVISSFNITLGGNKK